MSKRTGSAESAAPEDGSPVRASSGSRRSPGPFTRPSRAALAKASPKVRRRALALYEAHRELLEVATGAVDSGVLVSLAGAVDFYTALEWLRASQDPRAQEALARAAREALAGLRHAERMALLVQKARRRAHP